MAGNGHSLIKNFGKAIIRTLADMARHSPFLVKILRRFLRRVPVLRGKLALINHAPLSRAQLNAQQKPIRPKIFTLKAVDELSPRGRAAFGYVAHLLKVKAKGR